MILIFDLYLLYSVRSWNVLMARESIYRIIVRSEQMFPWLLNYCSLIRVRTCESIPTAIHTFILLVRGIANYWACIKQVILVACSWNRCLWNKLSLIGIDTVLESGRETHLSLLINTFVKVIELFRYGLEVFYIQF